MIKYVHTNIIARNWKKLAFFYENVLGCKSIPPERDLSGEWLEQGTGIKEAHIHGIHLQLPGYGDHGPTLEIFQYNQLENSDVGAINRVGLSHLAFAVDDVLMTLEEVLSEGGSQIGEVVKGEVPGKGKVTFVYARDPEGNILELQKWE